MSAVPLVDRFESLWREYHEACMAHATTRLLGLAADEIEFDKQVCDCIRRMKTSHAALEGFLETEALPALIEYPHDRDKITHELPKLELDWGIRPEDFEDAANKRCSARLAILQRLRVFAHVISDMLETAGAGVTGELSVAAADTWPLCPFDPDNTARVPIDPEGIDAVRKVIHEWDGRNWDAVTPILIGEGVHESRLRRMTPFQVRMHFATRQKPIVASIGMPYTATNAVATLHADGSVS